MLFLVIQSPIILPYFNVLSFLSPPCVLQILKILEFLTMIIRTPMIRCIYRYATKIFRTLFVLFYCTPITRKPAKSFYICLHYNLCRVSRCRVLVNAPLICTIVTNSHQSLAIAYVCRISLRSRCVFYSRVCITAIYDISAPWSLFKHACAPLRCRCYSANA